MTKEELDIQKEIEKYFTETTGFGRDKIKNFMDIVNKALKQKGERIAELEKENAEIDMKRKAERQIFQGIVEKKNEQLTKAKEIIRTFLNMPMPNNEEVFADVGIFLTKAEQFLKDLEK